LIFPETELASSFLWFIMELLPLLVVAPWHVFNSPSGIIHFHCLTAVQFRLPISYKQFQLFFSSPFATFEIMQLIARNPEHLTPKKMCSFAFLIPSCLSAGKCIINLTFARQKGWSGGQSGRVGTGVRVRGREIAVIPLGILLLFFLFWTRGWVPLLLWFYRLLLTLCFLFEMPLNGFLWKYFWRTGSRNVVQVWAHKNKTKYCETKN